MDIRSMLFVDCFMCVCFVSRLDVNNDNVLFANAYGNVDSRMTIGCVKMDEIYDEMGTFCKIFCFIFRILPRKIGILPHIVISPLGQCM